jgi:hypothetical protein
MGKRQQLKRLLVAEALFVRKSMIFHRRQFPGHERLETTTTTEIVEDLRRAGKGLLAIDFAKNEKVNGGDIELWLRGGGFFLGLRLQSKALHEQKKGGGIYAYLHHVVGKDGPHPRDQVDVLINGTKPPLVPMYLYYNGLEAKPSVNSGCGRRNGYAKQNGRLGLTVSSAHFVRHWWPFGAPARHLNHVLPHSVPLQCFAACDCPFSDVLDGSLPLQALEWPLVATGAPPMLILDPEYNVEVAFQMVDLLRARGVQIFDGELPSYVLELARSGNLPESADVNADAVAVIDGDRLA